MDVDKGREHHNGLYFQRHKLNLLPTYLGMFFFEVGKRPPHRYIFLGTHAGKRAQGVQNLGSQLLRCPWVHQRRPAIVADS